MNLPGLVRSFLLLSVLSTSAGAATILTEQVYVGFPESSSIGQKWSMPTFESTTTVGNYGYMGGEMTVLLQAGETINYVSLYMRAYLQPGGQALGSATWYFSEISNIANGDGTTTSTWAFVGDYGVSSFVVDADPTNNPLLFRAYDVRAIFTLDTSLGTVVDADGGQGYNGVHWSNNAVPETSTSIIALTAGLLSVLRKRRQ